MTVYITAKTEYQLEAVRGFKKVKILSCLPDAARENRLGEVKKLISQAEAVVIQNIDETGLLKEMNFKGDVIGGQLLYAYNSEAVGFYKTVFPAMKFIAPAELTDNELKALEEAAKIKFIYKVYGRQKLMTTAQYLSGTFRDEKGAEFIALHDEINNYSEIYTVKPVSMLDKRQAWDSRDILFEFTAETEEETVKILETMEVSDYIRGHHYRGID